MMLQGYSTGGYIDFGEGYRHVPVTAFTVSMDRNMMVSHAAVQYGMDVNRIRRTQGAFVHDLPSIGLAVDYETTERVFNEALDVIASNRNRLLKAKIEDDTNNMNWVFSECYLQSFSFGARENQLVTPSVDFKVVPRTFGYDWETKDVSKLGLGTTHPLDRPIPYWNIRLREKDDVTEFDFKFDQAVTPKFTCKGTTSSEPPIPDYYVFGLPSLSFSMTQVMYEGDGTGDISTGTRVKDIDGSSKVTVQVGGNSVLTINGLAVRSVSPSLDGVQLIKTEYEVLGICK